MAKGWIAVRAVVRGGAVAPAPGARPERLETVLERHGVSWQEALRHAVPLSRQPYGLLLKLWDPETGLACFLCGRPATAGAEG